MTIQQIQEYNQKLIELNYLIKQGEEAAEQKKQLQKELLLLDPTIKTHGLPNFKPVVKKEIKIDPEIIKKYIEPNEYQKCLIFNNKLARDLWYHDDRIPKDAWIENETFYLTMISSKGNYEF